MNLRIEDGILLKPYALARHDDGYSPPPSGWTPFDIDVITRKAQEIMALSGDQVDEPSWQTAKLEAWLAIEKQHYDNNEPWSGWAPVVYQIDRKIGRAYRQLFLDLNGGKQPARLSTRAKFPPDGEYEYRNGKMVQV